MVSLIKMMIYETNTKAMNRAVKITCCLINLIRLLR